MAVGGDQQVVDESNGADADGDGGAALHTGVEDLERRVDLLHGDQADRVAGEHRSVGAIAVPQSRRIDAQADPYGEAGQQQVPCLRERTHDDDRGHDTDDRADQPKACLLNGLSARRDGEDGDGDGGRRGRVELEPEARIEGDQDGDPDSQGEGPRGDGKAREGNWRRRRTDTHDTGTPSLVPMTCDVSAGAVRIRGRGEATIRALV